MHDPTKLAHCGHVHDMDREFTKLTRVDTCQFNILPS